MILRFFGRDLFHNVLILRLSLHRHLANVGIFSLCKLKIIAYGTSKSKVLEMAHHADSPLHLQQHLPGRRC